MEQGVAVTRAVARRFGHVWNYEAACGAMPLTLRVILSLKRLLKYAWSPMPFCSDCGRSKYDNNPAAKVRPEQGLLAMRKKLGLFANIRPVQTFDCLIHKSPLKDDIVRGPISSAYANLPRHVFGPKKRGTMRHTIPIFIPALRWSEYCAWATAMPKPAISI